MSGLCGSTRTREICRVSTSPTWVHVFPPSVVLYTPSPCDTLPRMSPSPVPTYTTLGLDSLTPMPPTRATEVLVARRSPVDAVIRGLEHAAASRAEPILVRSAGRSRDGHRPPAAVGANVAPGQRPKEERVVTRRWLGGCLTPVRGHEQSGTDERNGEMAHRDWAGAATGGTHGTSSDKRPHGSDRPSNPKGRRRSRPESPRLLVGAGASQDPAVVRRSPNSSGR